jgi:hypothetical protein
MAVLSANRGSFVPNHYWQGMALPFPRNFAASGVKGSEFCNQDSSLGIPWQSVGEGQSSVAGGRVRVRVS